ncbi:MAG TPA: DUF4337 domain-containing protein [Aliidongia sp.]|uniref:DUF4337 domain-containing protein n=1 Tax=Aliidongia sp. TaxID=1914230 RepID=UPI002DDD17EB|nr:DUF4337 domain-containing protein [Aliidongia sp.]HEV2674856.1 DUF4337 domain-containing protein [Aliidongia sp.]
METTEVSDHIAEAADHHHGHPDHPVSDATFRKRVGLFISLLAVLLAITGTGGSNAMKTAINANIERSDAWNFYQARNIRETATKLAQEQLELSLATRADLPDAARAAIGSRIDAYKQTIQHFESDPANDGKAELKAKAEAAEGHRDLAQARGESFEIAEALLQIAIVLASTCILTASRQLLLVSALFAGIGVVLSVNGFLPFFEWPFGH